MISFWDEFGFWPACAGFPAPASGDMLQDTPAREHRFAALPGNAALYADLHNRAIIDRTPAPRRPFPPARSPRNPHATDR